MKQAFRYHDEKSDKFWWIDFSGTDFAVNYGKTGTAGKYELKAFGTAEECEKQAKRLIAQKLKKAICTRRTEIDGLPGDGYILQSDQVILVAAFGQIKIAGRLEPELKAMALRSLDRMDSLSRVCGWGRMHSIEAMRRDIQSFCG